MIGSTNIRVGAGESIDNITLMKAVDTSNSFLLGRILASDTQYQNVNNLVNTYGVITYGLQNGVPTFPNFPLETCYNCNGLGTVNSTCEICSGSGLVTEQPVDIDPETGNPQYKCPKCNGWGYSQCQACNGMAVDITPTGEPFQIGTDLAGKTIYIAHSSYIDGEEPDFIEVNNEFDMTAVSVENWPQELGREPTEEEDIPMFYVIDNDQSYIITSLNLHGHDNDYIIVTGTSCSAGCSYGGFECDLCNSLGTTDNALYVECSVCHGTGEAFGYETCPDCGESGQAPCSDCNGTGLQDCYTCGGSGVESGNVDETCQTCYGTGQVTTSTCLNCNGIGYVETTPTHTCSNCNGVGTISETCQVCNGSGTISN